MFRRASNGQFTLTDAQYLMQISVCFSLNSVILPQARDRSWIEDSYQGNCHNLSHLFRKGSKDCIAFEMFVTYRCMVSTATLKLI